MTARGRLAAASCLAAVAAVAAGTGAFASATSNPPPKPPIPAYGQGELKGVATEFTDPTGEPPGVVNRPCTPAAAHPYPVVLVHGTFANENFSWQTLAPMLSDAGYCVYGFNYGATSWTTYSGNHTFGADAVEHSAAQLATFIKTVVVPDTKATEVDLVGHSQGGMMPRYMIDATGNHAYPGLGQASLVHTLVGLAPSNQGTTFGGLVTLFGFFGNSEYTFAAQGGCGACGEQESGSPFLKALNFHPDASGPNYYVLETSQDEVVTPYTNAFLPRDKNALNVTLQTQCPTDLTEHLGIIYDPVALQDVMAALANNSTHVKALPKPICPPLVLPGVSG